MNKVKSVIVRYTSTKEVTITFCRVDGTGRAYNLGIPTAFSSCKARTESLLNYLIEQGWGVDHHIGTKGFYIYLENIGA